MFTRVLRSMLSCALLAAVAIPTSTVAHASGNSVEVRPTDITSELVPKNLVRGDREFGGNGPDITCRVRLMPNADRTKVEAEIYFKAVETGGDRSTVEETFRRTIFTAPAGKRIARVLGSGGDTESVVNFRSEPGGFQLLMPGEDFKKVVDIVEQIVKVVIQAEGTLSGRNAPTREEREALAFVEKVNRGVKDMQFQGNHVHNRVPADGPVAVMSIVGDTGGDDISNDRNGKDDTRIVSIAFKKIDVVYQ